MAEYPIIMKQKNNQGDYDILYPKTLGSQVEGMTLDQVSGKLASNRIDGDIPSSQITGLPTSLPANGGNADTVGNQTVTQIIEAAISQGAKIVTGSYVGTGKYGAYNRSSLTFDFEPKLVIISSSPTIDPYLGIYIMNGSMYYLKPPAQGSGVDYVRGTQNLAEASNTTITWFNNTNAIAQLNYENITYYYIAIG